ncbi:hypothetical protein X975_19580, partial [Stegodyphus mimosarum]
RDDVLDLIQNTVFQLRHKMPLENELDVCEFIHTFRERPRE